MSGIVETALASDFWNLPLSVLGTPPADIALDPAKCSPRFLASAAIGNNIADRAGFQRDDAVFLNSYAIYSNLGDGLVPGNLTPSSMQLFVNQSRFFPRLTGQISNTAGTNAIAGFGTLFTRELCPGIAVFWRDDNGTLRSGAILSVTSDTVATLATNTINTAASMYTGNSTVVILYAQIFTGINSQILNVALLNQVTTTQLQLSDLTFVKPISGTVSTVAGNTNVVGNATTFTAEIQAGQFIRIGTGTSMRTLHVSSVTNNGALVLQVPGSGVAGVPIAQNSVPVGWNDSFICYSFQIFALMNFYTITIDPAFAQASRLVTFGVQAEIAHNSPALGISI